MGGVLPDNRWLLKRGCLSQSMWKVVDRFRFLGQVFELCPLERIVGRNRHEKRCFREARGCRKLC